MAGFVNTWIDQYTQQQTPCINNPGSYSTTTSFQSCLLWLALGLLIGSISFQKKGTQQ